MITRSRRRETQKTRKRRRKKGRNRAAIGAQKQRGETYYTTLGYLLDIQTSIAYPVVCHIEKIAPKSKKIARGETETHTKEDHVKPLQEGRSEQDY